MKSVLISIQPYWVFLIIAKAMGWKTDKEKTIEVRKNFPKAEDWNKLVEIYCSKDKKSFNRIPKEYQPLMEKFLGKVIGDFVCDKVYDLKYVPTVYYGKPAGTYEEMICNSSCLSVDQIKEYAKGRDIYGWHISNLKIYDKPKKLSEFKVECPIKNKINGDCQLCKYANFSHYGNRPKCNAYLKRPPQSWQFIEG